MSRLQYRKGRESDYVKRLANNPDWEEAKHRARTKDGHKCQMCGRSFNLKTHHKTYRVNGKSIVGHELKHLDCLVTLCGNCHSKVHKYHIKL